MMKIYFTPRLLFILAFFLPIFAVAQSEAVMLKSGNYFPAENARTVEVSDAVFSKTSFNNRNYVVIQFYQIPSVALRQQLEAGQIKFIDYLPSNAYIVAAAPANILTALKNPAVKSVFALEGAQKASKELWAKNFPSYAVKEAGTVDVNVITYEKVGTAEIAPALAGVGATIVHEAPLFNEYTLRVPQDKVHQLVNLPFIQWAEPIDEPNKLENLPGRTLHRADILNGGTRNLKGDGINVGIWDGGEVSPHLDFSPAGRLTQVEVTSPVDHSTHCAGTITGRGLINPVARGMAPNAKIYSYNFNGDIQSEMAAAIPQFGLTVSSHSYGGSATCGLNGSSVVYSLTSRNTDLNLNNFPNHLHVHSSGNSQTSCAGGWGTITGSGKPAKNNLLVAAITSMEAMTSFSSFGPVQDGRVKPDISAMGSNVFSTTVPLNAYTTMSGTSMATPGVAGTAILIQQRYKQLNGNVNPTSAIIKNVILNGAQDLGNVGPDYQFGWGRINALRSVRILENNTYASNTVATGATQSVNINVPAGASRLKVLLNWNDPAGAANANPALVNNLNLTVVNGATTYLPYTLDPNNPGNAATNGVDNVNNVEQVVLNNPAAGTYTLNVTGVAVPSGPSQAYSISWIIDQPYIEVIYPNGGESFAPAGTEIITWDNAGITGTQTLEYSLNNGGTWTTITSGLSASINRFQWTLPSGVFTGTALIRVSSGSISDVSDANFKILGQPSGLAGAQGCVGGSVNLTWNAVVNATSYDVYKLNTTTGYFDILATDVPSNSYSATGLPTGSTLWFTVTAKNNSVSAVSEKSIATSVVVSATGNAPVAGAISGPSVICAGQGSTYFSVPAVTGATGYTWTVPAGATIVGGQNTNLITTNFPAGVSGTVSVFITANGCNSNTSTLAVSVSSATVSAPVSGGNQTQNVCAPNPIPTLTATATPSAGASIVWYSLSSGGLIITNPILNTVGTITYWAASRTPEGCESTTRTPVILTITTGAQAAISAGSAVSFCQGNSVVLTANAGSAYSWSNGASTQSITVSTSGTYTATVTQANGCVSTSNAITVTVNALPTASVTAGGATSFCQGNSVTLSAPAASSYAWSNGATTQNITVSTSGNYAVTVTNAAGCSATSAATTVSVAPKPVVSLAAAPYTALYPGLSTTLTATATPAGTYTFTFYKNGTSVQSGAANTLVVNTDGIGAYTVKAVNSGGCDGTSSAVNIGDSATTKLFVYPNPNNGKFAVSYYSPTNVSTGFYISIFDSKGALVLSKSFTNNVAYQRMNIDIRKFGGGAYRVVLFGADKQKITSANVMVQ